MRVRTTRLWPVAIALLATTMLTGCGGKASTGNPASALGHVGDGSSGPIVSTPPSTSPSAGTSSTGTSTSPPTGGTPPAPSSVPAGYPKSAHGYADAVIAAYSTHKTARLNDLSGKDAATNFAALARADQHWHFQNCDGTAGTIYCTYDNNNGDRIRLMLAGGTLGKPHALDDFSLDRTLFSTDVDTYVGYFYQAWLDDNSRRLVALSTASVTAHFSGLKKPQSNMLADKPSTPDAGHTQVSLYDALGAHTEYVLVATAKLGHAHAISGLSNGP